MAIANVLQLEAARATPVHSFSINQSINTESAYTETWPALYK